jgi:hypothetical protein
MEMKVQVPFQKLLELVKALTPTQKAQLAQELVNENPPKEGKESFIDFLLKGPTYSKKEITVIKENRKSISSWRTRLIENLTIGEESGFKRKIKRAKLLNKIHAKYLLK